MKDIRPSSLPSWYNDLEVMYQLRRRYAYLPAEQKQTRVNDYHQGIVVPGETLHDIAQARRRDTLALQTEQTGRR